MDGAKRPPMLLGVTVLTSLDDTELVRVGLTGPVSARVAALAAMAQTAGMHGVVSAGEHVQALRKALGSEMKILVPGIRPVDPNKAKKRGRQDDQMQVATPSNATRWGADYLVVGRPITAAPDPVEAMDAIVREIALGERYRTAQA